MILRLIINNLIWFLIRDDGVYWYLLCIFYMSCSVWRILFWDILLISLNNNLKIEYFFILCNCIIHVLFLNYCQFFINYIFVINIIHNNQVIILSHKRIKILIIYHQNNPLWRFTDFYLLKFIFYLVFDL